MKRPSCNCCGGSPSPDERITFTTNPNCQLKFNSNSVRNFLLILTMCLTTQAQISPVSGTITVISQLSNESVVMFEDQPARFVPERVSAYGIQGYAIYANPANACVPVSPPPRYPYANVNWILVAKRFDCDFQKKIENAQNAGYAAIIVHNVGSNDTEAMGADNPSRLVIYACFIGEYHGHLLRDRFVYNETKEPPFEYYIRIQDDFSMNGYLLPFAIVVGVCFIVMLIFMLWQQVVRWIRERRRSRRRKLPSSALKKLPITKWTKGDPYETCAICLEDFVEQDKVRVLPCSHGFHSVCIDPWLTKGRRVCPICKRKVILVDERFPLSDTDTDDETAPLLGTASTSNAPNPASSTSTFVQQRENPFRRARRGPRQAQGQQPTHSDSDTASTTGSEASGGEVCGDSTTGLTRSHQSLPVLAQVHTPSFPQTVSATATTASNWNPRPVVPGASATPSSQSHFYVSCEGEPMAGVDDDDDEEMLDVSVEPSPRQSGSGIEMAAEPSLGVVVVAASNGSGSSPPQGQGSRETNAIV